MANAIHKALELGVTYFDTAPGYGNEISEKVFGMVLEGVDLGLIFLAAKSSIGDRDFVLRSVEQSSRNLRRDWIDLLQIHGDGISMGQEHEITSKGGCLKP
jgi:aryl-alcohol dehydrogenase-like predicted oxidoreductase